MPSISTQFGWRTQSFRGSVGLELGLALGKFDGLAVGDCDGAPDGLALGAAVSTHAQPAQSYPCVVRYAHV